MTIPEIYSRFQQNPVISTDSRNCPLGCLFFALKGANFNANAFAKSALDKGAAYAVVDQADYAVDERYIVVSDTLLCLQQLATYHRKQLGTTIVGITGTNGKTTTKELIAAVLTRKYKVLYTQGNLNNHIGVPLTLLQLTAEHEMAVVEMGANHTGDIKELADIACPDFGLITNVGKAHLEGFGSLEGVKRTKAELYDSILANGKLIFINADNSHLADMAKRSGFELDDNQFKYSLTNADNAKVSASVVSCSPFLKMNCKTAEGAGFEVATQLIGSYNAENVLAAVAIGNYFEVIDEAIKAGLEHYTPQNNRSQLTVTERNKLVVDAYNANPTSMHAAVINFAQMEVDAKMLILGDMLELGEQSELEHQAIVDLLKANKLENVLLVGANFGATNNQYKCFDTVDVLQSEFDFESIKDYYILIKGSRGIKLEKLIPVL
ncbi:MAG: UDP-N-acetylmuramoyl-tripeptide--D-alanyl-D-alanine ligase [Paludibacter sp.]|nr:UDP-N-acetylmuramoyl-tripeptide--D-alanyl-D-alanine ligase [Paludibacter sp.]